MSCTRTLHGIALRCCAVLSSVASGAAAALGADLRPSPNPSRGSMASPTPPSGRSRGMAHGSSSGVTPAARHRVHARARHADRRDRVRQPSRADDDRNVPTSARLSPDGALLADSASTGGQSSCASGTLATGEEREALPRRARAISRSRRSPTTRPASPCHSNTLAIVHRRRRSPSAAPRQPAPALRARHPAGLAARNCAAGPADHERGRTLPGVPTAARGPS